MIGTTRKQARTDHQMEFLLEKWVERHRDFEGPLDPDDICQWAIFEGIFVPPPPVSPREQLKRRLSKHLSHRYITDPQQREVRALHAVPYEEITPTGVKQGYRYYPLFTTEPEKIKLSLSLRRLYAINRVVQIENDRLSYNDNNVLGAIIDQLSFDFDKELADRSMPTSYPEFPPDDTDESDDTIPN